jgi:hypothetical protein
MTARDISAARLWAVIDVIDRPYKWIILNSTTSGSLKFPPHLRREAFMPPITLRNK